MRATTIAMIVGLMTLAVGATTGCKKKNQQPPQPYAGYGQQPGYPGQPGQPGYPAQPGQPGYPTQPGYGTTPGTAPAPGPTTAPPPAGPAPAGTACTEIDAAAASVAQGAITALASASIPPGAKPLGGVMAANCQQGQTFAKPFQMTPGKCYTVVGAGVGISELDVQVVFTTPVPGFAPVIMQDSDTGPQAVAGKNPNCHKAMIPAPVSAVLVAKAGSGVAAAQVYEK